MASRHAELDDAPLRARYALEGKLGRGGMGVVVDAHDRRIGRRVAIKRLAGPPTPEMVSRFVREARIQARLDHPAIAPVYDLGVQSDGRPYFAMRKLSGITLAELLHRIAAGDPEAIAAFPRARLLDVFVDVCLAIEHAHSRGVIHRDLKPGNVMLGEFGEVYVIDWGVAHVLAEERRRVDRVVEAIDGAGTAGYMAPEQHGGAAGPAGIDARVDVYALGCLLFEILAGAPLGAAADRPDPRPSRRAPDRDIPAELDAVCARAAAARRDDRYGSAREVADAVRRHLDAEGDAAALAGEAAVLVARARAALDEPGALDDADVRAAAMRDAGRALAVDPTNADAAAVVRELLLEPPLRLPAPVAAALAADDDRTVREQARTAGYGFLAILLLLPVFVWQGVRDWRFVGLLASGAIGMAAIALRTREGGLAHSRAWLLVLGMAVITFGISRVMGPFVFPPVVAVIGAMAVLANPRLSRAWWLVAAILALGIVGAWGLEEAGILAPTVHVVGGRLALGSTVLHLPPGPTTVGTVAAVVGLIATAAAFARSVGAVHQATRRRTALQAAHLRQLVDPGREGGA